MQRAGRFLCDNALSLSFFCLFAGSLVAQGLTGLASYNTFAAAHHAPTLRYPGYLATGHFLDAIFSNWQAALLQLGCLIIFSQALRQRGAPHSRKSDSDARANDGKTETRPWIYRHSLGVAFAAMFTVSLAAHLCTGTLAYNEQQALVRQPSVSVIQYATSGDFWFKTLQTWQAEFLGIGIYLVLSIFLREQGSAESKPVESSDEDTGEANE